MIKQASQPIDKKPYSSPVVQTYGNIRAITQSVGTISKNADGSPGTSNKTR